MDQTFACTACGAPNQAEAGKTRMACTYCGANLNIPENLRAKAMPQVEKISSKAKPVLGQEIDTVDLLRKAEPIAVKAWNMYAYWTWIRWLLPTCLAILVIVFFICAALGALPFVLNSFR